jgi:hypothetical protein
MPIMVAETGFHTGNISVGLGESVLEKSCTCILESSTEKAMAWMQYLISLAQRKSFLMLVWWSDRDLIPSGVEGCPCPAHTSAVDATYCRLVREIRAEFALTKQPPWLGELVYKQFGTMGLRSFNGTPKRLLSLWDGTGSAAHGVEQVEQGPTKATG